MVDNKSSWHPARILTCCNIHSFVLCYLCDTARIHLFLHLFSKACLDSSLQIRSQRPALTFIERHWQDKWFVEFNLRRKTDCALSQLSMPAPVWSLLPLMMFYPWFVWIPSVWAGPHLLTLPFIHKQVNGLHLILKNEDFCCLTKR